MNKIKWLGLSLFLLLLACQSRTGLPKYPVKHDNLAFTLKANLNDQFSHQVTITNKGDVPIRYMALMGFENYPEYVEQTLTRNGVRIINHNMGDLMHDYTLGPAQSISFKLNIYEYTLKVGFPIYDSQLNQRVYWFYNKAEQNH